MTLVSLSLASQQFGPRLLRTFMRDRSNQVVLGTFIGTFIYCMLVLRVVPEAGVGRDVPYLAVTFAVVLALVALAVLIYFIHHVAASIQADTVIMNVNRELHETMQNLYPHSDEQREEAQNELEDQHLPPFQRRVSSAKAGYVRAVDVAGLLDIAVEHNLVIHIVERPGRFVINGEPLADVYEHTRRQPPDRQRIDEAIRAAILVGPNRTAEQDIEFSIAQLVEIAVRSLSPSLNDPFTAMACLDRLGEAIAELGRRNMPKSQRHGSDGTDRVFVDRPNYSGKF